MNAVRTVPSDSRLIERSLTDPEVFAGIFDRHAAEIHRYLTRRVGASVAEDLTAETFLTAFRQRHRYDAGRLDARPWLYGIATNMVRHQRRTEIRYYRALARTGVDPVAHDHHDGVVDRVSAGDAIRRLAAALARLSRGERDVLLLVAWQQLNYPEIASALGIPIGTVRSRLHSARKRLRPVLGDLDPTDPDTLNDDRTNHGKR